MELSWVVTPALHIKAKKGASWIETGRRFTRKVVGPANGGEE